MLEPNFIYIYIYISLIPSFLKSSINISLTPTTDTLLNVFLAIAVDNLANAQELTKVQNPSRKLLFWIY